MDNNSPLAPDTLPNTTNVSGATPCETVNQSLARAMWRAKNSPDIEMKNHFLEQGAIALWADIKELDNEE